MSFAVETLEDVSACGAFGFQRLSPGGFHSSIVAVGLGEVRVYRARVSQRTLSKVTTSARSATIVCATSVRSNITYLDEKLDDEHLGLIGPGSTDHVVCQAASEFLICQLPASALEHQLSTITGKPTRYYVIDAGRGAQFVAALGEIVDEYARLPGPVADESRCRQTASMILDRFDALLSHGRLRPSSRTQAIHNNVFNRALEMIHQQRGPIVLGELASAAGASPRTLQRIFRERLQVSPQRYQRWIRMCRFHRELLDAQPDRSTVTEIASRWGFTEMGRLAGEYRELFGELPRITLMRRPGHSTRLGGRAA